MVRGKGKKASSSSSKRQANYRERKKVHNKEDFLQKHKAQVKKNRSNQTEEEKAEAKRKNREQKKSKYQEMKAAEKVRMLQEKEEQVPGVVEEVL